MPQPTNNQGTRYWQPSTWLKRARCSSKWFLGGALCLMALGLWDVFYLTPNDYQQGVVFKILYIHVPAAWFSLGAYGLLAALSVLYLVIKAPVVAILARACAWVGTLFCLICLMTGALWGRPMWGTYWVWDARLTSMALLLFLYVGYLALSNAFNRPSTAWKISSALAVIGALNLPIIKWSVDWWQTLHQPASIMKLGAPSIHGSMLSGLGLMALGFLFYGLGLGGVLYRILWERLAWKENK